MKKNIISSQKMFDIVETKLRELSRLIDQTIRAELDIKTGKKPAVLALEMLLLT